MTVRVVEGKKPYTGGKAIEITDDKVINLRLRDENNLIIYDEGDDEIYVDLQLPDEIQPIDAFPVGVTTGRVIVDNGWDLQGTIICAKTTSGDNIKLLYADEGTLWMDNGTGTFKQIYFKADVDLITGRLQAQIDTLYALGKFLSLWDCADGEPMSFPLETPYEYNTGDWFMIGNVSSATPAVNYRPAGDEWIEDDPNTKEQETEVVETGDVYIYDGTVWLLQNNKLPGGTGDVIGPASATDGNLAVFDGATGKIIKDGGPVPTGFEPDTQGTTGDVLTKTANGYEWSAPTGGGSDIEYVTQAEYNALLPGALTDGKHYVIYTSDSPTPPSPGWQPGPNTVVYYNINDNDTSSTIYDLSGNSVDQTWYGTPGYTTDTDYGRVAVFNGNSYTQASGKADFYDEFTIIALIKPSSANRCMFISQNQSSLRPIGMSINAWGNGKFEGVMFDGDAIQSSTSVQGNVRQMVAISYDGSGNRKIYVNGELDNTATQTVTSHTTGTNLTLGQRGNNSDYYNGQLKLLIGEDRCWTDQEIADLATEYGFNPS